MNNIKLDIPDITVVVDSGYAISVDGSGSYFIVADTATSAITASYALTSSFAVSALTSSYALNATATVPPGTVSSSLQFNSPTLPFTGSFTGSFRGILTGSTFGTASFAVSSSRAITSSFATTSSFAVSSSRATTSSFSVTASFVDYTNVANKPAGIVSSSTQINTGSFTGSFIGVITSASFATTASYVAGAVADWNTLANKPAGIVSSSTQINTGSFSGSFTGTFTGTASVATTAISASFAPTILPSGIVSSSRQINTGSFTGSFIGALIGTSSYANNANLLDGLDSSVFATTGSNRFNGNQTITGSLIQGLEGNIATGDYSHAEGSVTKAIGNYSHAEGDYTQAIGDYSHAEGQETIASGSYSHAEGYQTIALANHQHVQGQWNAVSSVPAAFMVGNGTDDSNRSNLIYAAGNEVQITGSLNVKNGITGSLFGTSSQAVTASYVLPTGLPTGIVSSSAQVTAFLPAGTVSSSRQINTGSFSGSITSASFATSASYAPGGGTTFPYTGTAVISGSLIVSSSVTASAFKGDGSQLTNLPSGLVVIDSYTFVGNGSVSNYTLSNVYDISSLIVTVGGLTQTSIIDYTLAGTNLSFLVAPASQSNILVRAVVNASTGAVGSFTGSLLGTASFATTASFALSASYAPGGGTTFPYTGTAVISGSLIVSSSVTASAFKGDGSQLTNLPSSSVVIDSYTFTGNGAVSNYTLNNVYDISSLTVVVGGLTQTSIIDYTLAGTNLSFLVAPPSQSNILVRALVNTSVGVVGSFTGSFTGDGTGLTGVTATVFPYVGAAVISGSLTITGSNALNITGSATILGAFQATTKSFKIDHQRLLGKKLIYGVLEGPEHGVYVRGRLTKNNIIQLPEEWEWLVDSDSITVQLTPIAIQQALYVQNIENNTVIINSSTPIDCFYYVQATRKDVNTLQTVE